MVSASRLIWPIVTRGRCPVSYTNRNVTGARDKLKQVRVLTLGICLYGETHHGGYPPGPGHIVPWQRFVVFPPMTGAGTQGTAESGPYNSFHCCSLGIIIATRMVCRWDHLLLKVELHTRKKSLKLTVNFFDHERLRMNKRYPCQIHVVSK